MGLVNPSVGVGRFDQDCSGKWVGLIKVVWGTGQDWSSVPKGVGRIGKVCLQEWVGLVRLLENSHKWN